MRATEPPPSAALSSSALSTHPHALQEPHCLHQDRPTGSSSSGTHSTSQCPMPSRRVHSSRCPLPSSPQHTRPAAKLEHTERTRVRAKVAGKFPVVAPLESLTSRVQKPCSKGHTSSVHHLLHQFRSVALSLNARQRQHEPAMLLSPICCSCECAARACGSVCVCSALSLLPSLAVGLQGRVLHGRANRRPLAIRPGPRKEAPSPGKGQLKGREEKTTQLPNKPPKTEPNNVKLAKTQNSVTCQK